MANANQAPAPTPTADKTVTIVINNSGPDVVQPRHRAQVTRDGFAPRIIANDPVVMKIGFNLVDTDLLRTLRENPGYDARFSAKIPNLNAPEYRENARVGRTYLEERDVLPAIRSLSKLPEQRVISFIEDMDENDLRKFMLEEERPMVRLAMMNRLMLLENPTENALLVDV